MELYDPQHVFYKDYGNKKSNAATLCWDAVATAVGITSCLNIAYAMFMYHVSFTCEKESSEEVKGLVTARRNAHLV